MEQILSFLFNNISATETETYQMKEEQLFHLTISEIVKYSEWDLGVVQIGVTPKRTILNFLLSKIRVKFQY